MKNTWGRLVRERRKELRLTIAELAHRCGYSENTIKNIEGAKTGTRVDVLEQVLNALDYDLEVVDVNYGNVSPLAIIRASEDAADKASRTAA